MHQFQSTGQSPHRGYELSSDHEPERLGRTWLGVILASLLAVADLQSALLSCLTISKRSYYRRFIVIHFVLVSCGPLKDGAMAVCILPGLFQSPNGNTRNLSRPMTDSARLATGESK
jgi:hypothetical protein